jgi:hypothetical protein
MMSTLIASLITEGARPYVKEHPLTKISKENCSTIIGFTDSDGGGGYKLNGQNNTFISNCTWNGKRGMKAFRNDLSKSERI